MTRAALVTFFAASVLLLCGCAPAHLDNRVDADTPVPDDLDNRTELSCSPGDELVLNNPSTLYTITGPCVSVTVDGTDLIVRAEQIENLVLHGDRLLIELSEVGVVQITGDGNTVIADAVATVVMNGDDNTVTSDEPLSDPEDLTLNGSGNVFDGP